MNTDVKISDYLLKSWFVKDGGGGQCPPACFSHTNKGHCLTMALSFVLVLSHILSLLPLLCLPRTLCALEHCVRFS